MTPHAPIEPAPTGATPTPCPTPCPECGTPPLPLPSPHLAWGLRRLPLLAVLGLIAAHTLLALVPGLHQPGSRFIRAHPFGTPAAAPARFVPERWTVADLYAIASASESARPGLARAMSALVSADPDADRELFAAFVPPAGTRHSTRSRGWPFPFFVDERTIPYEDPITPAGVRLDADPGHAGSVTRTWTSVRRHSVLVDSNGAAASASTTWSLTPWILAGLAALLGYELAVLALRIARVRSRRSWGLLAGALTLAGLGAASVATTESESFPFPDDQFNVFCEPLTFEGQSLTAGLLAAIAHRPDVDRKLAVRLLQPIPHSTPQSYVLVVRARNALPISGSRLIVNPGFELLRFERAERLGTDGRTLTFPTQNLEVNRRGTRITAAFPNPAGATSTLRAELNLEGLTLLGLRFAIVLCAARLARSLAVRLLRTRRVARSQCVACGYHRTTVPPTKAATPSATLRSRS